MTRWRLTVIILILGCLLLIVAATRYAWSSWGTLRFLRGDLGQGPTFLQHPWITRTPTIFTAIGAFFTLYLSGILVLFTFPRQIRRMEQALSAPAGNLAHMAILGFSSAILIIVVGLSSALTMGTFPLTIFLGSILFLSIFAGFVALSYTIGHKLLSHAGWGHLSPIYALLLGLLVMFAFGRLPLLGILLNILFASFGMGVIIATRFGTGRPWNLSPLWED